MPGPSTASNSTTGATVAPSTITGGASSNVSSHRPIVDYSRDMKPMGMFGAPACRSTPSTVATCATVLGVVLIGIGIVLYTFFPNETIIHIPSIIMAVGGVAMVIGGVGFFIFYCFQNKTAIMQRPTQVQRPAHATMPVFSGAVVDTMPTAQVRDRRNDRVPPGGLVATGQQQRQSGANPTAVSTHEAPPTYDAVLRESNSSLDSTSAPNQQQQQKPIQKPRQVTNTGGGQGHQGSQRITQQQQHISLPTRQQQHPVASASSASHQHAQSPTHPGNTSSRHHHQPPSIASTDV